MTRTDWIVYGIGALIFMGIMLWQCSIDADCDAKGGVLVRGGWTSRCIDKKAVLP